MRIGILADIHDDADRLAAALAQMAQQRVDQIVVLGDTLTCMGDMDDTSVIGLLREADAIGVWGNHDFGLCGDVSDEVRCRVDPAVLDFMSTLQPYLQLDSCFFSHVEPWIDPWDVSQLWYYDGPPDTPEKAARSFAAVSNRFLFLGHFHRWLLMTPSGQISWFGAEPIRLGNWDRCLVAVAPVFDGHCAVFDTKRTELVPLRC
jgi:hypothetical protein